MKFHPIANLFPMLPDNELKALAEDIKQHGQREVIVSFQDKILDGRNRWTACTMAEVKPRTKKFDGTKAEAIRYVWSTNFHRRHLTSSQAGMALAERKKMDPSFVKEVVGPIQEEAKQEQRKSKGRGKKGVGKIPHLKASLPRHQVTADRGKARHYQNVLSSIRLGL